MTGKGIPRAMAFVRAASRDRLIVQALKRDLAPGADWSPGFFEQLRTVDSETAAAVDELLASVRQARTSKPPRSL